MEARAERSSENNIREVSGRIWLHENNRIRTVLCIAGIHNRGADRRHLRGKEGRRPSNRLPARRDRKTCTSILRTGTNRRSGKAIRDKVIRWERLRASGGTSRRMEALTWYRRRRPPEGLNQKTNWSTWRWLPGERENDITSEIAVDWPNRRVIRAKIEVQDSRINVVGDSVSAWGPTYFDAILPKMSSSSTHRNTFIFFSIVLGLGGGNFIIWV